MIILAIDTGSTSGAAWDGADGIPRFSTWHGNRWSAPGEFGPRLVKFEEWLLDLIAVVSPDRIVLEAPLVARGSNIVTNADTVRLLYSLAGLVEKCAAQRGIECFEVNVMTVKKQFTGNGRAQKADVMFRARQLGWGLPNEHEADACAVWFYAKAALDRGWCIPLIKARGAHA